MYTCTLIMHVTGDGRAALKSCITEPVNEILPVNPDAPFSARIFLNVVKSGLIRGGPNVTLKHYDTETECIGKIQI